MCGIYLALLAVSFREKSFAILISAGVIALILTVILTVRNKFLLKDRKTTFDVETPIVSVREKFGTKDLILMLVLTAVYAAAVFSDLEALKHRRRRCAFRAKIRR